MHVCVCVCVCVHVCVCMCVHVCVCVHVHIVSLADVVCTCFSLYLQGVYLLQVETASGHMDTVLTPPPMLVTNGHLSTCPGICRLCRMFVEAECWQLKNTGQQQEC